MTLTKKEKIPSLIEKKEMLTLILNISALIDQYSNLLKREFCMSRIFLPFGGVHGTSD
jgi:hypothetical protein